MFTRKKKFFVLSAALLFVSCLLLAGCSSEQNQQNTPSGQTQTPSTQNPTGSNSNLDGNNNTKGVNENNRATETNPLHVRAEKIADAIVDEVEPVKDARVIISEKMAYVSVSIPDTADADTSKTLKEDIGQVVKKTDTDIEDVFVMEDADTFTRMKEMAADIADGKPVSGFVEELNTMFTRVMPSKG